MFANLTKQRSKFAYEKKKKKPSESEKRKRDGPGPVLKPMEKSTFLNKGKKKERRRCVDGEEKREGPASFCRGAKSGENPFQNR